jgi:hypothetical protein
VGNFARCLAPGRANTGPRRFVFAAAGQIPGQADDVLGTGPGLREQFDDPSQRDSDLSGHIGLIFTLLAAGLAGQHDPSAGTIDRDAV